MNFYWTINFNAYLKSSNVLVQPILHLFYSFSLFRNQMESFLLYNCRLYCDQPPWRPWPPTALQHLQGHNFKHFWGAILKKLTFHFSFVVYYDACIVFKVEKHAIFSPIWLPLSYDHRRMHCGQREGSAQCEHSWRDPEKPWLLHGTFALPKIETIHKDAPLV